MAGTKDAIRSRLAKLSLEDGDFQALVDLVNQDMEIATGGFQLFSQFQQYCPQPAPGCPATPPGNPQPPQVPEG